MRKILLTIIITLFSLGTIAQELTEIELRLAELSSRNVGFLNKLEALENEFKADFDNHKIIVKEYNTFCRGVVDDVWEQENQQLLRENEVLLKARSVTESLNEQNALEEEALTKARKAVESKYDGTDKLSNEGYTTEFSDQYIVKFERLLAKKQQVIDGYRDYSDTVKVFQASYKRFVTKCKNLN